MGPRRGKKKKFPKPTTNFPQGKVFPFPFLEDKNTIDSIKKQFGVLFVMRGIPGSGKSTLVKEILRVYQNAIICSADHYFMENDVYIWSPERRYYAHQYSMKLAEKCCEMNCPFVIIDNTNITEVDAKFYFKIALKYSYVTVLVSPQTPWRFDPVQLEKHGKHNVSLKALRIKVKLFQDIIPEFYAWVIGHQDAQALKALAVYHFQECLKHFPQLKAEISKLHLEEQKPDNKQKDCELEDHFNNILKESLFCIAKNCSKGKIPGSIDFHSQDNVQSSCGKVFVLQVAKILVTPHFLLSCVELNSQQMILYGELELDKCKETNKDFYKVVGKTKQEEEEEEDKNDLLFTSSGYTDNEELHQSCLDKVEARLSIMLSKIKPGVEMETLQGNVVAQFPLGKSHSVGKEEEKIEPKTFNENLIDSQVMAAAADSEAHFAIGAFRMENKEEENVQSEPNDSLSREKKVATILLTQQKNDNQADCHGILKKALEMENLKDCKSTERISTDDSDIFHFQNGICIVHLKEKFQIEAIFSGHY